MCKLRPFRTSTVFFVTSNATRENDSFFTQKYLAAVFGLIRPYPNDSKGFPPSKAQNW